MNSEQMTALNVGLWILASCALFPPRKYAENYSNRTNGRAPRAFLLFGDINTAYETKNGNASTANSGVSTYTISQRVEFDIARMLAEWVLIVSATGSLIVLWKSK